MQDITTTISKAENGFIITVKNPNEIDAAKSRRVINATDYADAQVRHAGALKDIDPSQYPLKREVRPTFSSSDAKPAVASAPVASPKPEGFTGLGSHATPTSSDKALSTEVPAAPTIG